LTKLEKHQLGAAPLLEVQKTHTCVKRCWIRYLSFLPRRNPPGYPQILWTCAGIVMIKKH